MNDLDVCQKAAVNSFFQENREFFVNREVPTMIYTMMQVCKKTNMTYQALKFYCNEGLVPNVKRDKNNRRVFDERDVAWIESLTCLKKCGMSIQEMKEYLELCLQGPSSIPRGTSTLASPLQSRSSRHQK